MLTAIATLKYQWLNLVKVSFCSYHVQCQHHCWSLWLYLSLFLACPSFCLSALFFSKWVLSSNGPSSPSDQIRSVAQSCPTLWDPMNRSTPGLPVHHQLPEFTETHVHRVSDAIQPSHPLLSPSPPAPNPSQHQSLFQWVNSSHQVAKYWTIRKGEYDQYHKCDLAL